MSRYGPYVSTSARLPVGDRQRTQPFINRSPPGSAPGQLAKRPVIAVQHRVNPQSPHPQPSQTLTPLHPPSLRSAPKSPAKHRFNPSSATGHRCSAPGHLTFSNRSCAFTPGSNCATSGHPVSPEALSQPRRTPLTAPNRSPPTEHRLRPSELRHQLFVASEPPPTSEHPPPRKTPRQHAILRPPPHHPKTPNASTEIEAFEQLRQ